MMIYGSLSLQDKTLVLYKQLLHDQIQVLNNCLTYIKLKTELIEKMTINEYLI